MNDLFRTAETGSQIGVAQSMMLIRDYQILCKVGEGGMGTVYKALHRRLDTHVAIKLLRNDRKESPEAINRFEREMRALGGLKHPNIVSATDAGEENGTHFLVMEFIEGVDLGELVAQTGPFAIADACEVVRQAAIGLAHAHGYEKVHRDVKPGNLMLSSEGTVKVLDLGLAQFRDPFVANDDKTREGQVMGTNAYMSPEQLVGAKNLTAATDVYSLGVTLYQFLAGTLPLKPGQFATQLPPLDTLRTGVPGPVKQVMQAMLSPAVQARISSMDEVAQLLESHAAGANLPRLLSRNEGSQHGLVQRRTNFGINAVAGVTPPAAEAPTAQLQTTDRQPPPVPPPLPKEVRVNRPPLVSRPKVALVGLASIAVLAAAVMLLWPTTPEPPIVTLHFDPEMRAYMPADEYVRARRLDASENSDPIILKEGPMSLPPGVYELESPIPVDLLNDGYPVPRLNVPEEGNLTVQVAPRLGVLTLQVADDDTLFSDLLDEKNGVGIFAQPVASRDPTDRIRLRAGENRLLVGDYRLETSAWMVDFTVQGESMSVLTLKPDRKLFVRGKVHSDFPWSLPEIPTTAGAWAASYGTLSREKESAPAAEPMGAKGELAYDLRLTVRDEVDVADVTHRWLEVEVATGSYVERGYLLFDANRYRNERKFVVERGWIEARSPVLQEQLESVYPESNLATLVVAFDPSHDAIKELAEEIHLSFPADRVSVQEAMALLFEADFTGGLPPAVVKLRKYLAAQAKFYFESGFDAGLDCMVVRAPSANYELARAKEVPFNFVSITVKTEDLQGEFKTKDYNANPSLAESQTKVPEAALAAAAAKVRPEPGQSRPFDVVALPTDAGSRVEYRGSLAAPERFFDSLGGLSPVTVDFVAELWVGDAAEIEGVPHVPLQLVVKSGRRGESKSVEKASLWVAESTYRSTFRLRPHPNHSFVEIGGHVFPLETGSDTMIEDMYRLGHFPPAERIGVYDAISLLFDASFPAARKFGALRAEIAHEIIGSGFDRKHERKVIELSDLTKVWGEVWQPPLKSITYHIYRSRKFPWGITEVLLEKPKQGFKFTAEEKNFSPAGATAIVDDTSVWQENRKATWSAIKTAEKGKYLNFQLWRTEAGDILHWAEYLAHENNRICLRDAGGQPVVVDANTLAPQQKSSFAIRKWTRREDNATGDLEFVTSIDGQWKMKFGEDTLYYTPATLSDSDRVWVADHLKAKVYLRSLK